MLMKIIFTVPSVENEFILIRNVREDVKLNFMSMKIMYIVQDAILENIFGNMRNKLRYSMKYYHMNSVSAKA